MPTLPSGFSRLLSPPDLSLVASFVDHMENGPKPLRRDTVVAYLRALLTFTRRFPPGEGASLPSLITKGNINQVLITIPQHQASLRRNFLFGMKAFARCLSDLELIDTSSSAAIAGLMIRSTHKPQRHHLSEEQIQLAFKRLLAAPQMHELERLTSLALLATYVYTGLRNSELRLLKLADVSFENGMIHVVEGKGGKSRVVGLPRRLEPLLKLYLIHRLQSTSDHFFLNARGAPFTRDAIIRRFSRISKVVGFRVHAHALRRTFTTHVAHHGVPLDKLQVILGHADITTTRMYVQTSGHAVAQEMRDW